MAGQHIFKILMICEALKLVPLCVGDCRNRAFVDNDVQTILLYIKCQCRVITESRCNLLSVCSMENLESIGATLVIRNR